MLCIQKEIGLSNSIEDNQHFCIFILFIACLNMPDFQVYGSLYFTYFYRFESCWAAMAKDTNGIVFVYNPDQPNQDKDLESW